MAELLHGAPVAQAIAKRSRAEADELRAQGVVPALAILRVGERDDDLAYERGAIKRCEEAHVDVRTIALPEDVDQETVLGVIDELNSDDSIHGILMLRPLPDQLDEEACCEALASAKDVDAATTASLASVFTGSEDGFAPCTARACMEILRHHGIETVGKRAAVIGRSLVVGKPVSMMLMAEDATPTTCHTKTVDMPSITQNADIVVVATGQTESIGAEHFREGQAVIDVGIGWDEEKGRLVGDVVFDEVEPIVSHITPVPGGVGAVTTAILVENVVRAAQRAV